MFMIIEKIIQLDYTILFLCVKRTGIYISLDPYKKYIKHTGEDIIEKVRNTHKTYRLHTLLLMFVPSVGLNMF